MRKLFLTRRLGLIYLSLIIGLITQDKANAQVQDTSTYVSINFQTVPFFARNVEKTKLVTHYNFQIDAYVSRDVNEIVKNYCTDRYPDLNGITIAQLYENLRTQKNTETELAGLPDMQSQINREVVYAISAVKLFRSQNEGEINANIRSISNELREIGYTDFEDDFMPFLARMLSEHRKLYFDADRITVDQDAAKGIVTPMEILGVHSALDPNSKAAVCRDVQEYALRLMRQSFDIYYNQDQQKKYNADDYIFLQAWVTPSSQHITVLFVDPANPRNGYDLDWGRIYQRENQEGLETPNNVGMDIRLFKFDKKKNYTVPFMLHKTERGRLFDMNALSDEEHNSFNSTFARTLYSDIKLSRKVNERWSWNASVGRLSSNLTYVMGSLLRDSRKVNVGKFFSYQGKAVIQPQYYEDSEIRSRHLSWIDWRSSHNVSILTRYLAKLETNPIKVGRNISLSAFSHSQIYLLLNASMFNNSDLYKESRIQKTGDGNIFTTYGANVHLTSATGKLTARLAFQNRNFLAPKEVRLLSPNPAVLIRHARVINSANNIIADVKLKSNVLLIGLKSIYEYDLLKTQQLLTEINIAKTSARKNLYTMALGFNKKLSEIDYYWYAKDRLWLDFQYAHTKSGLQVGSLVVATLNEGLQTGLSLQKRL